jgi:hemerythrin-like metal-binding protein/PAS domain S-box-containing protein
MNSSIDIFPWDDNFNTGVSEIDVQHKQLVKLLNTLASHIAFQTDVPMLEKIFDELTNYTIYHFQTEESIWKSYLPDDPSEHSHRQSHAGFVTEVITLRAQVGNIQTIEIAEKLLGFLARWLASHILESDRHMAYVVLALKDGLPLDAAKYRAKEQMGGATRVLINIILSIYASLSNNTLHLMRELTEHREAKEALSTAKAELEESKSLLQTVIDNVPVRVFWKDLNLNYLGCNPSFAKDAGKNFPYELVGHDDYQMGWASEAGFYREDDFNVIKTGVAKLGYEEPQTTPDGNHIWLRSSKVPLKDKSNKTIGVLGVYEDITKQKQAEQQVQESENKFRSLYLSMTEGVALHELVFSPEGNPIDYVVLDVNPAYESILGLDKSSIIGQRASEIYGEAAFLDKYAQVAVTGNPIKFSPHFPPMGKTFSISVFSPVKNQFATIFQDITRESSAKEALEASEERLRLALNASSQAWFDLDLKTGKFKVSPNFVRMCGYDPESFTDELEAWMKYIHPDDLSVFIKEYNYCLAIGDANSVEYRLKTDSGDWLWVQSIGKIVRRDEDGTPTRMSGIHINISERKKAENEQQRLNRALRLLSQCNLELVQSNSEQALLDNICQLIIDTGGYLMACVGYAEHDTDKNVRIVSEAGSDLGYLKQLKLSWDENSAFGRGPTGLAITTGKTQVATDIAKAENLRHWQAEAIQHNCRSSIALPLNDENSVIGSLNVYAADTDSFSPHEIRLLEELATNLSFGITSIKTKSEREEAIAANRAKSYFIANISHEIRTPLNAISGMVYLLRRSGVTQEQDKQLHKIDTAQKHLLEIINAVLDLSKIESDKISFEETPIDINSIIDTSVAMVQDKINEKSLTLNIERIKPAPKLIGDATRLQQALLNYLSNSVKFTEHGAINISAAIQQETPTHTLLRFEVEDTGIGIAADVLPRLFSDFEQADNSTTRKFGGTGLGLAITKKISQLLGGNAGATSQIGIGSTFWFTVLLRKNIEEPTVIGDEAETSVDIENELRQHFSHCNILLVEDDLINQEIASLFLEEVEIHVEVAENGLEAYNQVQEKLYDLIIMDMQMPIMGGLEATEIIRRLPQYEKVPIIAMTGNAFVEDKQRCLDAGMTDFIPKPIDAEALFMSLYKNLKAQDIQD